MSREVPGEDDVGADSLTCSRLFRASRHPEGIEVRAQAGFRAVGFCAVLSWPDVARVHEKRAANDDLSGDRAMTDFASRPAFLKGEWEGVIFQQDR